MTEARDATGRAAYPWRGFLFGAVLCAALAYVEPYVKLRLHTNGLCTDYINAGAVVFLFIAALVASGFRLLSGRWLLRGDDLAVVFSMLAMACAIPSHGLLAPLLSVITGASYYANDTNQWAEFVLPKLPKWMIVRGDAAKYFYEKLPDGQPFPWSAWAEPAVAWGILILAVYTVMVCVVIVLYEQWSRREKLGFPLARLPYEMTRAGEGRALFRQGLFWAGLVVSFVVVGSRGLAYYYPNFPALPRTWYWFRLLRETTTITVVFSFVIIGFSYLLNTRVLLSIWFFHLLIKVVSGTFTLAGVEIEGANEPWGGTTLLMTLVNGGAMIALVLFGLWAAREHLWQVLREAWQPTGQGGRRYRHALVGMVLGLLVIGVWLNRAGVPAMVVPVVLAACFITITGLTRIVVQAGVGFMCNGMPPAAMTFSLVGTGPLTAGGVVALGSLYTWAFEARTTIMASAAEAFRILELRKMKMYILPLVVATVITLTVSSVTIVRMAYRVGGANLRPNWFLGMAKAPWNIVAAKLRSPITPPMVRKRWVVMSAGAGFMALLMFLNYKLPWFPLHYIGFPVADVWMMNQIWASVFVAWLVKTILLRYGGARTYARSIPFALGLIMGQLLVAGIFMFVESFTGKVGHFIDVGLG